MPHGQLLDDQHEPGTAVDDGVTDQLLVVLDHIGDVTQTQRRLSLTPFDGYLGQVIRGRDGLYVPDAEAWLGVSMKPPGADE